MRRVPPIFALVLISLAFTSVVALVGGFVFYGGVFQTEDPQTEEDISVQVNSSSGEGVFVSVTSFGEAETVKIQNTSNSEYGSINLSKEEDRDYVNIGGGNESRFGIQSTPEDGDTFQIVAVDENGEEIEVIDRFVYKDGQ